jgi:glycosyltransferase involved in cell wall biosynthesis
VSCSDGSPIRVLYLLTDEISSVLVRGQLGHLVVAGFEVTVATRLAPESTAAWDAGVEVVHLPFVREPSPIADLGALWTCVGVIRRLRPTIVNASTPKAGLIGMVAARLCRVPVRVYVVRGLRFETAVGWRRRLFRSLERVAMRCSNHVVFNSPSLMAVAEREGLLPAGSGEVIGGGSGNGVSIARFAGDVLPARRDARAELGLPADAIVVGYVGRFTRDKGIADLIGVFTSTLRRRDGVHLLLVGQFEDGDPVSSDVRNSIESDDRIVTVPWLAHTGVVYRAMDVLAFPSYREGLPNVPLEAQLCGVPVVAYAATGTVDAVAHQGAPGADDSAAGVLVPVGGTGEMAAALSELIDDPARRAVMGAAGPAWVTARFAPEVVWDGLVERYRSWSAV